MITSFRLVMPPKMKNSANTNTRRSGASTPLDRSALAPGSDEDVVAGVKAIFEHPRKAGGVVPRHQHTVISRAAPFRQFIMSRPLHNDAARRYSGANGRWRTSQCATISRVR